MVQRFKTIIYDGAKAVPAWDFDNDKGWTPTSGETEAKGIDLYFRRVPWLYRAVIDRSNNVAAMPFAFTLAGNDVATSQDYEPPADLDFIKNPGKLFAQIEQSLAMVNKAYLYLETNRYGYVKSLKYCTPNSIEEVYDKQTGALIGYKRRYGKQGLMMEVPIASIVAIYGADYLTEVGPAHSSDAMAALTAAGVLFNADKFISNYFERGAIKATVLSVEGGTRDEHERLQSWWGDVVAGIKNAWSAVVMRAKSVVATVIGEGLEGLQNNELTTERRQDIATALGVPESHMWSAAANYATAEVDEQRYWKQTITPECEIIAAAFNEQLFTPEHQLDGYKLEFRPETLEIFQQDAAEQAQAANTFADLFEKFPSFDLWEQTLVMHGYELPEKLVTAAKKYYADKEKRAEEMEERTEENPPPNQQPEGEQEDEYPQQSQASEMDRQSVQRAWRRKAELWLKKNGSANCPFETDVLPQEHQAAIRAALERATNNDEIKAAINIVVSEDSEVKRMNDLLAESNKLLEKYGALLVNG